jgi:hypothetical protein
VTLLVNVTTRMRTCPPDRKLVVVADIASDERARALAVTVIVSSTVHPAPVDSVSVVAVVLRPS